MHRPLPHRPGTILALGLGLLGGTAAVAGQSAAERSALLAWTDTLEAVADLGALEALEGSSRAGDGTLRSLRRAHWVLRHGELRDDRSEMEVALFDFSRAASSEAQWPWPRYAIARTLVALEHREYVPKAGNYVREGESHASAIWRAMQESLERDPGFAPSRDLFLELALAAGYREQRDDVRAVIRGYASPPISDWRALLVEGRIAHADGEPAVALARFDSVLALGGDSGLAMLDRARALHALGRTPEAREAYWASLASPTPATRTEHRVDLWWITSADTLAAFDTLPADSLLPWMRRFWLKRDAENLRAPGERLTEHLRRWNLVRRDFRIPAASRRTEMKRTEFDIAIQRQCTPSGAWSLDDLIAREPSHPDDIRRDERLLDHRAIIYLRHGEPLARSIIGGNASALPKESNASVVTQLGIADVSWFVPPETGAAIGGASANREAILSFLNDSAFIFSRSLTAEKLLDERVRHNESWLYWVEGGYRVLHFTGSQALGLHAPTTLNTILPLRPDLYIARVNLFPSFAAIARVLLNPPLAKPHECHDAVQEMMRESRADATVAAQADSYTPVFEAPFVLYTQFFGLGSAADGSGRALVAFAIPSPGLRPGGTIADGRTLVPIRFRLTFFDPASGANRFIDTTRTFATRTLERGTFLSGIFEVPLPAGEWQMGLLAMQDGRGTGGMARQRGVAVTRGSALALGDLVTGREGGVPTWDPGDGPVPLNPFNAWPSGGNVELWFELRGLAAGDEYRATYEVEAQQRGRRGVKVEARDRATGPVTAVRRTIQLRDIEPGDYLLRVTVTAGGQTATRGRTLTVVKAVQ